MRKMAKKSKISPRIIRRICHNDLKMLPYKLQKRQLISGATIKKRLARSKLLLKPGLGSHCRRAPALAPTPELSSTHSLAPTPALELSSAYPLAPAPAL